MAQRHLPGHADQQPQTGEDEDEGGHGGGGGRGPRREVGGGPRSRPTAAARKEKRRSGASATAWRRRTGDSRTPATAAKAQPIPQLAVVPPPALTRDSSDSGRSSTTARVRIPK